MHGACNQKETTEFLVHACWHNNTAKQFGSGPPPTAMLPASPCQLRIWPRSIAGWPWHTCMCIKSQGIIDPCNCSRETCVHSNPRYILVWQGQNAVHFAGSNPWMRATCGPSSVLEASSDAALNTGHHTLQSYLATVCEKAGAIHVVSVTYRAANGYTRQIS